MPYTPPIGDDILLEVFDSDTLEPTAGDNISLEINEGEIKGYFVAFDGTSQSGGYVEASFEYFDLQANAGSTISADLVPISDADFFGHSPRTVQFINGSPWVQQNAINYVFLGSISAWYNTGDDDHYFENAGAATLRNKVFLFGGENEEDWSISDKIFYSTIDSGHSVSVAWTIHSYLPYPLGKATPLIAKDRLFLVGADSATINLGKVLSIEVDEDEITGSWSYETPLPETGLCQTLSAIIKNRLYIFGGYIYGPGTRDSVYYTVVREDGSLGAWIQEADLPANVVYGSHYLAVAEDKGFVYIVSGSGPIYYAAINEDGSLGTWGTQNFAYVFTVVGVYVTYRHIFIFYYNGQVNRVSIGSDGTLGSYVASANFSSTNRGGFSIVATERWLTIICGTGNTDVEYYNHKYTAIDSGTLERAGVDDGVPWSYVDTIQGTVFANFELIDGGLFQGGILYGDLEPWNGEFIPVLTPHVFAEFQLWNGTFWCNLMSISGSFSTWYGELSGAYAYNMISADFPRPTADIYAGGNMDSAFESIFETDSYGTVGQSIGVLTYFARWDGILFAGGRSVEPYPEVGMFTAEISGHVTHINRVQADLPLFDMTGSGHISGSGQISSRFEQFNSNIEGKVENPAILKGEFAFFSMTSRGHKMQRTEISGQLLAFSGQVSAKDTTPGNITADFETWTADLRRSFICVKDAATTSQDVKFNGGLGL